MRTFLLLGCLCLAAGTSGSCVTTGKFNKLKERTIALENRLERLEHQMKTMETRLANLMVIVEKEDQAIRDDVADTSADVDDLRVAMGTLEGRQEVIEFKLEKITSHVTGMKGFMEDRFGTDSDVLPEDLPDKPEALYEVGKSAYESGLTRKARAIFREFLKRHPDHDLTDDAQFMIGETFFAEGRFTESVQEFKAVYDQYQSGDRYREAVMRIGLSYVRSNKCKKALKIYQFAAKNFKGSAEGDRAREEADQLRKVCK